jgi:predicted Rdx family selenoprotein
VGAASDLLHDYQHVISELTLITGSHGVFDVTVDGAVLFSKHASRRHAKPGEVLQLFRDVVVPTVDIYPRS